MSASGWFKHGAAEMAVAVRRREVSVRELVQDSLDRIAATDNRVNAFTDVTADRALRRAAALDADLGRSSGAANVEGTGTGGYPHGGQRLPPLLGVPFAVKNLFDIEGLPTLAGSKIERGSAPAAADGLLVRRMEAAGAVLVGALNMDEYAYGFTTENSHEGATHNPHDLARSAGGSSGGSGAAVAAGQVPIALGSDTNGSIRVPSSLCGVFGLKPTFGRLPRTGSYPFVASLDHLGPFARSALDLALSYDALQGFDAHDPACVRRPPESTVQRLAEAIDSAGANGPSGLRCAVLGGYFHDNAGEQARAAVAHVARALRVQREVELPEVARARAAAFLISNAEGAALHLPDLRTRPGDFEPLSRDRFLAGALLPAAWVVQAQRARRWFARRAAEAFADVDILLAPATPLPAQLLGTEWLEIGGQRVQARPSFGVLTQPISCIGLPVCCVPVWLPGQALPIGVQVIAAPWREDHALHVAAVLEELGAVQAPVADLGAVQAPVVHL